MESKRSLSAALFLSINLLFFAHVSSCNTCVQPKPIPNPNPYPSKLSSCPKDALKLGVCAKVLDGAGTVVGSPFDHPCCSIIQGLLDLEAAVCLCTAIKANILGININIPIVLNLLINTCGTTLPSDFVCS